MAYDFKGGLKKITKLPLRFLLMEGTKSRMLMIAPTAPSIKEVEALCGGGKPVATGVCFLEGTLIVFKTKAEPKPAWTASVKKIFADQKAPALPFEFRQMGENETEEGLLAAAVPAATAPPPASATAPRPATAKPAAPVQAADWSRAKPAAAPAQAPSVAIGANVAKPKPVAETRPGNWKPAAPTANLQAKAELDRRFKSIVPRYQMKLAIPEREAMKERLFKEAGVKAGAKDGKTAHAALDDLELLVGISLPDDDPLLVPDEDPMELFGPPTLADRVVEDHQRAGLLDEYKARNTAAAKEIGLRLIKADGGFDDGIDALMHEVAAFPPSPNRTQVTKTLTKLKTDPALRAKIAAIGPPEPDKPMAGSSGRASV